MSSFEIATNFVSVAVAIAGVTFVYWTVQKSGADRREQRQLVDKLVETAPYERLSNIFPQNR